MSFSTDRAVCVVFLLIVLGLAACVPANDQFVFKYSNEQPEAAPRSNRWSLSKKSSSG